MIVLRMDADTFDELLNMIKDSVQKQDTQMRQALPVLSKLEVTLQYLASGDSLKTLSYFFHLPPSSISTFLPDVLIAIRVALASYLQVSFCAF